MISDAIIAYEQELDGLKWQPRLYDPTASRYLPVSSSSSEWRKTYKLHGEVVRAMNNSYRNPSLDDIAYACKSIQAGSNIEENIEIDTEQAGPSTLKVFSDPRITARYMPSETESQLCDCPYWGTEFS